ncbi:MAG: BACON domain-containing carbohydrate-binding protein [Lentimicrobium sp.]
MKKKLYLFLFLIVPFIGNSQELFRSGKFLHHSTGGNIWGPNGSSTSIPQEIASYNAIHGYTGNNAISMTEQWWPGAPVSNDNEWERWHRIFDNEDPNANILPILAANKIVVVKSCYPSSAMTNMGGPWDTLYYTRKSMYNHKWHMRSIVRVMAQYPENFFALWTNAPLVAANTNANAALLSKRFTTWMKDTLAQGLDPEIGMFPPNIYVFHYFKKLTDENGFERPQYAVSSTDSHPNASATELVAPQFVNEIFSAAIAYEQGGPTLSLSTGELYVSASAGAADIAVYSNTLWTASSNQDWCTVTPSGFGNGTIAASYTQNASEIRTATISVSVSGLPATQILLTQYGNQVRVLNLEALLEGLYIGGGTMKQACDENGPRYSAGIADHIILELHNAMNYANIEYTAVEVPLSINGTATVEIPYEFSGDYYITIRHRNSIQTTSANPVSFTNEVVDYVFDMPSSAFGSNLCEMPDGWFAIYSSDVDQNGTVDTGDITPVENLSNQFYSGYSPEDVNGDGLVDTADQIFLDNNQADFISTIHP